MIGIIGGTGLYQIDGLSNTQKIDITTPFGKPSAHMLSGILNSNEIVFLPRHGLHHEYLPSEVNYRANIYALKSMGVTQVIGVSAVGSLREKIKPGDFSVPNQYFDWTTGTREKTFFGNGMTAHISTADPVCPNLSKAITKAGKKVNTTIHTKKAYACVEGPRLGSKIESNFLRNSAGCDLVGMTNIPEVFLAVEAQMCYATITIATDYDCWLDDPDQHVSVEKVLEFYSSSLKKVKSLLIQLISHPAPETTCTCRISLKSAILTPEEILSDRQKQILTVLKS